MIASSVWFDRIREIIFQNNENNFLLFIKNVLVSLRVSVQSYVDRFNLSRKSRAVRMQIQWHKSQRKFHHSFWSNSAGIVRDRLSNYPVYTAEVSACPKCGKAAERRIESSFLIKPQDLTNRNFYNTILNALLLESTPCSNGFCPGRLHQNMPSTGIFMLALEIFAFTHSSIIHDDFQNFLTNSLIYSRVLNLLINIFTSNFLRIHLLTR